MKQIFVSFLLIAFVIGLTSGFECYSGSTARGYYRKECFPGEASIIRTGKPWCFKVDDARGLRGCWAKQTQKEIKKGCITRSFNGVEQEVCLCSTELCNGGPKMAAGVVGVLVSLIVVLVK